MMEEEGDQVLEQQCNETVIMIIMKMMMIKFNYKTCVYAKALKGWGWRAAISCEPKTMSSFLRSFVANSHSFIRRSAGYTRTFSEVPADLRVKLSPDGKGLALFSGVAPEESHYHVKWLRHNCQCSQCLSSSGQKTVTADHLLRDDNIERVKLIGIR